MKQSSSNNIKSTGNEVFIFQEDTLSDNLAITNTILKRPLAANAKYAVYCDREYSAELYDGFLKHYGKPIDWTSVLYDGSEDNPNAPSQLSGSGTSPMKKSSNSTASGDNFDRSFLVLPRHTNILDFKPGAFLKYLNQACQSSKSVYVISYEVRKPTSFESDEQLATYLDLKYIQDLIAQSAMGALLCAQWEFMGSPLKLLRLQHDIRMTAKPELVHLLMPVLIQEYSSNKKVLEVFYQLPYRDLSTSVSSAYDFVKSMKPATLTKPTTNANPAPIFTPMELQEIFSTRQSATYVKVAGLKMPAGQTCTFSTNPTKEPTKVSPGIFIITGGLGSLGLCTAKVLIRQGVKKIALVSRSGKATVDDKPLEDEVRRLAQAAEVDIQIFSCDVSQEDQVIRMLGEVRAAFCQSSEDGIAGIIHSAGILRDGLLCSMKAEQGAQDVWNAKVTAAYYLDKHTRQDDATFSHFINFSSLAASVGNVGQSSYALANRALEGVVKHRAFGTSDKGAGEHRRNPSFRTANIRWPGVIGAGMGRIFDPSMNAIMVSQDEVMTFLDMLFTNWADLKTNTFTIIPKGLPDKVKNTWFYDKLDLNDKLKSKILEEVDILGIGEKTVPVIDPPTVAALPIPTELATVADDSVAPSVGALKDILYKVRELVTRILGKELSPSDDKLPLLTIGLDSVAAAELANELSEIYSAEFPPTLLYSYPSIEALSNHIHTKPNDQEQQLAAAPLKGLRLAPATSTPVSSTSVVSSAVKTKSSPTSLLFPTLSEEKPRDVFKEQDISSDKPIKTVLSSSSSLMRPPSPPSSVRSASPTAAPIAPKNLHTFSTTNSTIPHTTAKESIAPSSTATVTSAEATPIDNVAHTTVVSNLVPNSAIPIVVTPAPRAIPSLDDVCIVGISMDFPQGITSLEGLWNLLENKNTTISRQLFDIETDRAIRKSLRDSGADEQAIMNKIYLGHFLTSEQKPIGSMVIDKEECKEFKMTVDEFKAIHISQKLLLKNCKKALRDCGYYPNVSGKYCKNTGVFIGIGGQTTPETGFMAQDQSWENFKDKLSSSPTATASTSSNAFSAYSVTSTTTSVAAGRLSFALGFEGPCMAIDTACSSSLVALHQARRALQLGECDMAIVGGINLLEPWTSTACAVAGMTAADGLCRTFDASAEGYGRAEGCGVIVLKRQSDVLRDGDKAYSIIKGSAVQQDGSSASLTAPNGLAQEAVIRAALRDAKLGVEALRYIETHGTGTVYGDPVETAAIANLVATSSRPQSDPLFLTAIKANVGHLEAAAGLAGLFSVIASLQYQAIPPNAHLKELNPIIAKNISGKAVQILSDGKVLTKPPAENVADIKPFYVGVSSFGYSGTISHVILEEVPPSYSKLLPYHIPMIQPRSYSLPLTATSSVASSPARSLQNGRVPIPQPVSLQTAPSSPAGRSSKNGSSSTASSATNSASSTPSRGNKVVVDNAASKAVDQLFSVNPKLFKSPPQTPSSAARIAASSSTSEPIQTKSVASATSEVIAETKSSSSLLHDSPVIIEIKPKEATNQPKPESNSNHSSESDGGDEAELSGCESESDSITTLSSTTTTNSAESAKSQSNSYEPTNSNLAWQFSGQGNLKINTAKDYYETNETYRQALHRCNEILKTHLNLEIIHVLYPETYKIYSVKDATIKINSTRYSQAILIAVEYSLAQMAMQRDMKEKGDKPICPAAVTGHSLGEYTACIIAGILSLEDTLFLISERGRIIDESRECQGQMVALRESPANLTQRIKTILPPTLQKEISIAAINGKESLILSGSELAVQTFIRRAKVTMSIPLAVSHAFHSPLLKKIVPQFQEAIAKVTFQPMHEKIRYYSTYLGREVPQIPSNTHPSGLEHELMKPEYWVGHMVESVKFCDTIEKLYDDGFRNFLELGPEKVLMKLAQPILKAKQLSVPDNGNNSAATAFENISCYD